MTLVNHDTGEIIEALSKDDARRLTDRIRLIAESVAETLDKLADLIDQARTGSAWLALGYRSWTEYVASEFSGVLPRLEREPRQEFVRELASRGMSTRAIAPVVGVSQKTVDRDARESYDSPQTPEGEVPPAPETSTASVQSPERTTTPRPPVTGIDGKTYQRPAPIDHAARADAAVAEFPDLAYYAESDPEHCWRLADTLRTFGPTELPERLANLRRSIKIDRSKRDGTYVSPLPRAATCPTCGQTVKD